MVRTLVVVLAAVLMGGCATSSEVKSAVAPIDDRLAQLEALMIDERLAAIEALQHAHEAPVCEWVEVGYNKSHAHDTSLWCPTESHFLAQLDLNNRERPYVFRALCCSVP